MKKIILAILIALSPMMAKDYIEKQNPFFNVKSSEGAMFLLDSMPHFMGMYMNPNNSIRIKNLNYHCTQGKFIKNLHHQ